MLKRLIHFSLRNRLSVLALAALVLGYGGTVALKLPIDVFPNLNRPTVTLMTEAAGLAPEEVETLISIPLETALNGAPGVQRVRAQCGVGLSIIYVEFDWGQDIYRARQLVQERVELARPRLPLGTEVHMGPISSLMGEILLVGLTTEPLAEASSEGKRERSPASAVLTPPELRTLADWELGPRLLTLSGVSQVMVIGGGRQQLHINLDSEKMAAHGVGFEEVATAAAEAQGSSGGGFLIDGPRERLIRNLARSADPAELGAVVIRPASVESEERNESTRGRVGPARAPDASQNEWGYATASPLFIRDVADVALGTQPMRGDAGVNAAPAVILAVQKQPDADTTELTRRIERALEEMRPSLPPGVQIQVLFRQATFIENAIANVKEAIRDGSLMVILVLFVFLLNFRTTFITLTAIPLSFALSALVFQWLGVSINTMTLGGLAVAVGLVVDDAIVDVENVFRRLRENRAAPSPLPTLKVIGEASSEVRSSILYATLVIVLVFLPLFALSGIEGQFFAPIGIAIIVSMLASFLVSLTVIPALCSYLLPRMKRMRENRDAWFVRVLKAASSRWILGPSLSHPWVPMSLALVLVAASAALYPRMGKTFLPEFNEGTAIVSLIMPPGTSLEESDRMGRIGEKLLLTIPEIEHTGRRTGRAELDEHAEGVHRSEIDIEFAKSKRSRAEILGEIREKLGGLPGVVLNVGQPISHRLDHMLSGVQAAIAVKISGPDLAQLRRYAAQAKDAISNIEGLVDLQIEAQTLVPQVRVEIDRERAAHYGLRPGELSERLEAGLNGRVVSQVLDGTRSIDLVLRYADHAEMNKAETRPGELIGATRSDALGEAATPASQNKAGRRPLRSDIERLRALLIDTPLGGAIPLAQVADVHEALGPNAINREDAMRRIVISANVGGSSRRALDAIVADIQTTLAQALPMESGYFISYEGQFQSQQAAARLIGLLALLTLAAIFLLLYSHFRSAMIVAQVLLNVPLSFIGALALTYWTIGTISVATLVGLITLAGIATRNTIMMISHYLHLIQHEGEKFGPQMILRGSLERLVPVTMTALAAGLALIPLALAAHEPGKEILYPVAIVILGGLLSSTLLDMAVTPAVFLKFGKRAAAAALAQPTHD
ncbi:multidrug transporter AcrB [Cephaloticoccus capnophilus]|uniref:Multidrug transporter AcrB n=1 Tax=Cephaloticoccus capnophilus TaxID=1548208 RepID=A0A139SIW9_9BACT|nr:efflux RND transporter permease subunit [Cephaloticoccus capnophilus]KXU34522.1 multidrug transporter AcrB [Cephaloticoccus capnophilus]